MTRYFALRCETCKDVIISRARHDFNTCSCEENYVFLDGDTCLESDGYTRWSTGNGATRWYVDIPFGRTVVYQDWNKRVNSFQKIDTSKYPLIEIPAEEPENK